MSRVERDADTGEEIIFFYRRGRPYLYLRMSKPPRWFIRRLRYIEVRTFMVVDYSIEEAKKGNPLYIDAGAFSLIEPDEFMEREEIAEELEKPIKNVIEEKFSKIVVDRLLEDAGIEYGSEPYYRKKYKDGKCMVLVIWKHRPEVEGKKYESERGIRG